MMKKVKMFEGLQEGDLRDLVLSLISIDQYVAKTGPDDEVLVIALFVSDQDAAKDLVRFVSKTDVDILDVEASPAPNPEGYWLVFIEMFRNEQFPKKLVYILDELRAVTEIKNWQARIYQLEKTIDVNEKNLKKYVKLEPNSRADEKALTEWLSDSKTAFEVAPAYLNEQSSNWEFETLYFGEESQIPEEYACMECLGTRTPIARNIQASMGSNYRALDFGDHIAITKTNSPKILLVKRS